MKAFLKIIHAVPALFLLATLGGCVQEREDTGRDGEATLTIDLGSMLVPDASTRALTAAQESAIETLDLLAFKWDGSQYLFSYYSQAMFSRADDDNYNARATVQVDEDNNQLFVLVANARDQVRSIAAGTELETAQQGLIFTNADPWNSASDSFDHIPMYMRSTTPMLIDTYRNYSLSGKLIRMVARIDVNLKGTVTNFRLAEAYVFNRKNKGHVAYKSEDIAYWDPTAKKALKPYVPTGANTIFEHTTPYTATDGRFERTLYTFEAEGRDDADFRDATAVVVGGYFDYPTNQTKITYYRIDIPKVVGGVPDPDKMGDILRNHRYEMRIAEIKNEGAPTAPQAFFDCVKIEAEIVIWDMADVEVKFDMTHWLRVSQAVYDIMPDGTNRYSGSVIQSLDISSNYDGGWYAELYPADATDWIEFWEQDGTTPLTFPMTVTGNHEAPDYNFRSIKFKVSRGDEWGHAVIRIRCGGPGGKLAKYVDVYRADFTSGEMFDWIEADMGDGGNAANIFRLGVSRGAYTLSRDKQDNVRLIVNTDYEGGYTVTADKAWITLTSPDVVTQTGTTTVTFDVEKNTGVITRTGKIRIRAGTIEKVINITQLSEGPADGELETFPWENPVFDDGGGTNMGSHYTLATSMAACRYDGNAKTGITVDVRADGRGDADKAAWTAATNVSWITVTQGTGEAPDGGATSQLVFDVAPTDGSLREGEITVTLGTERKKIEKHIKVTQYPELGITLGVVAPTYRVSESTESKFHTIDVTASYAGTVWQARADDPSVVYMRQSAGKGSATPGEEFVAFSLLPEAQGNTYTITIYSPTGEFDPVTATISAVP